MSEIMARLGGKVLPRGSFPLFLVLMVHLPKQLSKPGQNASRSLQWVLLEAPPPSWCRVLPSPPRDCHGETPFGIAACGISLAAPVSPQAPCISDELCSRVYDFCKKLLTLPKPFCTIGLDYAARLKMERTTPGTMLSSSAPEFGGLYAELGQP